MLRCLIIDDEPLAVKLLQDHVEACPYTELAEAFHNPIKALQSLEETAVDLIFLDVQMPELSGVQFAKIIQGKYSVVLTTAYPDYALKGYELDIVDYLLKPISLERFERAVQKVMDRLNGEEGMVASAKKESLPSVLFVKSGYKTQRIDLEDIRYLEGLSDYVRIQTADGPVLTLDTLKHFAETLPSDRFVRVHRSWIVAIPHIDYIERNRIIIGDQRIPISATYQEDFWKRIHDS
jgi:DNA-binding LytR/AlgR family response regulator